MCRELYNSYLLVRYFEEQSLDTANRPTVRTKYRDLHVRLSVPKFQLYLYFLHPHLSILASLNKWLQSSNISLHTVYSKIQALLKTFISPVALDSSKSVSDDDNLHPMEEALLLCPGSDFQKHLADCSDHALMSERELREAKQIN